MISFFTKAALGIDIGVSSIKVVELSLRGTKKKLENYVEFQLPPGNKTLNSFHSEEGLLLVNEVAAVLRGIFQKAAIKQKRVAFALPDFSTFFTTFSLPPMSEEEVPKAIEFEARHHIPIPLPDVTFDWQIIEKEASLPAVRLKVLLVAVPKKVLQHYQKVAALCGFEVRGMEAEVFGLIRSVVLKDKYASPVCLVDLGRQSTTISIVKNQNLVKSHSFDISSRGLTKAVGAALNISLEEAEALKRKYGLDPQREDLFKVLTTEINNLAAEVDKVCRDFSETGEPQTTIEDIIISGGSSALFGLSEYLSSRLKKNVKKADPFESVIVPPPLQDRLTQLGPSFAVALGVGMMGVES